MAPAFVPPPIDVSLVHKAADPGTDRPPSRPPAKVTQHLQWTLMGHPGDIPHITRPLPLQSNDFQQSTAMAISQEGGMFSLLSSPSLPPPPSCSSLGGRERERERDSSERERAREDSARERKRERERERESLQFSLLVNERRNSSGPRHTY